MNGHLSPSASPRERIRALNDQLRRTFSGGRVVETPGIRRLPPATRQAIRDRVRRYDGFGSDHDPHGEHDLGVFDHEGWTIFWKIDYYDRSLTELSEDPTSPDKTVRVLTIMLADEY